MIDFDSWYGYNNIVFYMLHMIMTKTIVLTKDNAFKGIAKIMSFLDTHPSITVHYTANDQVLVPYEDDAKAYAKAKHELDNWESISLEDMKKKFYTSQKVLHV